MSFNVPKPGLLELECNGASLRCFANVTGHPQPSALWLRLHEKVMAGPNKAAAAVASAALSAQCGTDRMPAAEELGAPRSRDPVKVAMAAVHGAQKQLQLSRQPVQIAS